MALLEDTTLGCSAVAPLLSVRGNARDQAIPLRSSFVLGKAPRQVFKLTLGTLHFLRCADELFRQRHNSDQAQSLLHFLSRCSLLAQVSLATRSMMLVPQHATLSGRIAADHMQLECHQQFNSSRPVARRASLKVSAFESQTQPWKKSSSSSSSRYISAARFQTFAMSVYSQ